MHEQITKQGERKELAPFSCSKPDVQKEKPGTKPEHWDAFEVLLRPLYADAGPQFPDGILFAQELGGMPKPTPAVRAFFTDGIRDAVHEAKKQLPDLCSAQGKHAFVNILKANYGKHHEDFKEYVLANCETLIKNKQSLTSALHILGTGAKALISALPDAAKFVPNEHVRSALAEIILNFDLESY